MNLHFSAVGMKVFMRGYFKYFWAFLFFIFIALSSHVLASTTDGWPLFHGNPQRNGFSESSLPSSAKVLWSLTEKDLASFGVNIGDVSWPIISDNIVYLAADHIFAIDLFSKDIIWNYKSDTTNFFPSGLAVGDGIVFVTVNDTENLKTMSRGSLYALDKKTGEFKWVYEMDHSFSHALPLLIEGIVYVADDSGYVHALQTDDGSIIWEKQLDTEVLHSSPAYSDGYLLIGTEGEQAFDRASFVYALDAQTGDIKWKFEIDVVPTAINLVHSTAAIEDGIVYIGSENGYFYALSLENGHLVWKRQIADGGQGLIGTSAGAAVGYGGVFIGTWQGNFYRLDAKSGEIDWVYAFEGNGTDSSPVLADHKVCFGAHAGMFTCLSEENGTVLWQENLGSSSAAVDQGVLVVTNRQEDGFGSDRPLLYAFSDEDRGIATFVIKEIPSVVKGINFSPGLVLIMVGAAGFIISLAIFFLIKKHHK